MGGFEKIVYYATCAQVILFVLMTIPYTRPLIKFIFSPCSNEKMKLFASWSSKTWIIIVFGYFIHTLMHMENMNKQLRLLNEQEEDQRIGNLTEIEMKNKLILFKDQRNMYLTVFYIISLLAISRFIRYLYQYYDLEDQNNKLQKKVKAL